MKTRLPILKFLLILCSTFATTAVFGQTVRVWTGDNNGNWDTTTANNWQTNGVPAIFANGGPALFDDTVTGTTNVTITGSVQPSALIVNNSSLIYSIVSSPGNDIAGSGGLTKLGTNTLSLSGGANAYTGITTISGGTVTVSALANGGLPSDIGSSSNSAANLVLDGGTLQYVGGGASSDRLFTLGTNGATIGSWGLGALNLTYGGSLGYSGSGPRALTLTGSNTKTNTLAAYLTDNGGATSLTKNGTGNWVVTGNNTYSGGTTIANGVLQVGVNGASGSLGSGNITDNGTLVFNRSDSVSLGNTISGSGSVVNNGWGSLSFSGDITCSGGIVINSGTVFVHGKLNPSAPVVNNSQIEFYNADPLTLNGVISGTGQMGKAVASTLTLTATNTFFGDVDVYEGSLIVNGRLASTYTRLWGNWGATLGGAGTLGTVVEMGGGTIVPGPSAGSIGTLTASSLSLGGNVAIDINKSLVQSNDFIVVVGVLTNTGTGTVIVSNLGPALVSGDKFTLFSKPVQNGAAMTVVGAGVTWGNNLAIDGSIVFGPSLPPGILGFANLGNNIQLFWAGNYKLQAQTNSLLVGLSTNWSDYPGGSNSPVTVPIVLTNEAVFFRLAPMGSFVYDQQSTTSDTSVPPLGAGIDQQPFGQSFVPTLSSVGFIRLFLADVGVPGAVDATVYVNLWADAIGTGTLLGSTASVFLPVGFDAPTIFFFSPPVTVNPGTTYYFQPVAEVGGDFVGVGHTATGTAYTNGTAIFFGTPVSNYDLWFREGIVAP